MTDEELAEELEFHVKHGIHAHPPLLYAAAERLYALSAHVALLKASLAQAERVAEKATASAEPRDDDPTTHEEYRNMFRAAVSSLAAISDALGCDPDEGGAEPILAAVKELKGNSSGAEPFGYFHATPFGWEACAATDEGAKPLYERAPDQLDALQAAYSALLGYPYRNEITQVAMEKIHAAIAKATGEAAR